MQNLLDNLKNLLQKDERLISEGELLKNKIIELAINLDKDLIELLLADKQMKEVFFTEAGKATIFDKDKFIKFVSNKQFLPDSYTAFKNKIGLTEDDEFISEKKEVVLSWPYKDCVLEGGMTKEDQKRDEIFWNETLAPDEISRLLDPKVFTNAKRIDTKGEHKLDKFKTDGNGDIKDNLIIKGNNLLALHSLKKRFAGRVKLIYIDPPYNTGGSEETFTYNNNFKHSTWLTFMKNRLEVARGFLKDDGFIAIAIDDFELFYLGALADSIFGRENRIGIITVIHKPEGRNQEKFIATSTEYMLVYAKDKDITQFNNVILSEDKKQEFNLKDKRGEYKLVNYLRSGGGDDNLRINKPHFYYPIYVNPKSGEISTKKAKGYVGVYPITSSGQERTWKTKKETLEDKIEEGRMIGKKNEKGNFEVFEKYYAHEVGQLIKSHWIDKSYNAINYGTKLLERILGRKDFSYPKSLYLVSDTIKLMSSGDDIVMDFFAGSATTGHAVWEANKDDGGTRRFILVEQIEKHMNIGVERLSKVIKSEKLDNTDFVNIELAKWNENFVEKIQKAKTKQELKKLWETMKEKARLSYKVDIAAFDKNAKDFADLSIADQKRFLLECLDKNHLYVNYSEIDDGEYGVSTEDKKLNKEFYKEI